MSFDWPVLPLGEITINFDSKRKPVKESERKKGIYPYYGASGIVDYVDGFIFDGDYLLIAEDGENLRSRQTPIAFMAKGKFWVNNHAHIVTANNLADTRFLMYSLQIADVNSFITGAVMPKVTKSNLNKIPIVCPPIEIQKSIVDVLGGIDDRISLLRETNTTLEAIAQTLFKSWFVDFDPVKAKAEGRLPEGMDEATAELFPSEFEESALGLVPKGWRVGALSELCKIASGKRPIIRSDNEMQDASIPLYGGAGIMGFTSESLFHEPKILTGRVGTLGKVHLVYPPFWASDNVLVLSPIESRNFLFCFRWVSEIDVYALNRGSTQPLLTQKDLGNQQRILPTDNVLDVFTEIVDSIYEKIRLNVKQSKTLTTLRDTLLPRLISGQLRLNQAQEVMDEVGA